MFEFSVVGGRAARAIIAASRPEIVAEVQRTYLAHEAGETVNPDSYFLRFPDKPSSRIIALPAYLGAGHDLAGIKWISSFPANIERQIPRASAVLVLNDYETGYPFALLEASQISAARTAASAVLAAEVLRGGRGAEQVTMVGAGIIGRNIAEFLAAMRWDIGRLIVYDQVPGYADAMARFASEQLGYRSQVASGLAEALGGADLAILATTAATPYISDPAAFRPGQVVLNISLRDIDPVLIAGADNILDDIEHCLKAGTSPHLAVEQFGHRAFITGTLAQVITRAVTTDPERPVIFSPFGLGVLDLAVGSLVYREAVRRGEAVAIPDFFGETSRW
jgi:2,3-diaminopropionate biosynthesis protein SbnB